MEVPGPAADSELARRGAHVHARRERHSSVIERFSLAGALIALLAPVAIAPAWAQAERSGFFEETAQAFWAVQHECDDGSIAPCRSYGHPDMPLIVRGSAIERSDQGIIAKGWSRRWFPGWRLLGR